jgi:predicted O-methyltransferase YrrM
MRRIAGHLYGRLLAPFGLRALDHLLERGLPARLTPALRSLFSSHAPDAAKTSARPIESIREQIAARDDVFRFAHSESSLGPIRLAERTHDNRGTLTSRTFAKSVSVPRRWGVFLHLCADAFEAKRILEMGACVGISSAYLSSVRSHPHIVTLEGSPHLAEIAAATLEAVSADAEIIIGPFEETLEPTLERLRDRGETLEVAFVDGHHEEVATLHYVAAISRQLAATALIVLDDIYLYEGMWRAWRRLSSSGEFVAVNVGRFGLLVREPGVTGRPYDLSRFTGYWHVGGARARAIAREIS